jgi:hypothetical protein
MFFAGSLCIMPFIKGMPKPAGSGRKAGVNYTRKYRPTVREQLEKLGVDIIADIVKLLPELEPKDRFSALMALLPYAEAKYGPKLAPQDNPPEDCTLTNEELAKLAFVPAVTGANDDTEPSESDIS